MILCWVNGRVMKKNQSSRADKTVFNTTSKKLITVLSFSLAATLLGSNSVLAELYCGANSIPETALSKGGNKVTICHFPPGNPTNYQVITISTNSLNTHCDHHDDVFASNGLCPPITTAAQWQYLDGAGSWNTSTGVPNTLGQSSCTIPSDLLERVKLNLPEGKNNTGSLGANAVTTNISLKSTAKFSAAYLTEGAGYNNAIGYFNFNTADLNAIEKASLGSLSTTVYGQITEKIIFPNFDSSVLKLGDAVNLGMLQNNTTVGFTLVSDGWMPSEGKVNDNQSDKNIFRTIRSLNTEKGLNNLDVHALMFSDVKNGLIILAFEDLNRDTTSANNQGFVSDNDFNDVVLAICVEPFNAIENISQIPVFPNLPVKGVSGPASWRQLNF